MVCSSIWGRPRLDISKESILSLRRLNYSWTKVARLLGISRKILYRRLKEYNIDTSTFTDLSESELDELLSSIKVEHPNYQDRTGQDWTGQDSTGCICVCFKDFQLCFV